MPMATIESSPLWDVDCFSLSARPQVRWRERRRCDYQTKLPMEEKLEKLVINNHNHHQQHHLHDNKDPHDNDVDEQEIIIKHNDSTYDLKQYQTQC